MVGLVLTLQMGNAEQQPPPPAPVPPNASLVTATVLKYSIWNSKLLQNTMPPIQAGLTLYSLIVEVHTSKPVSERLENFAKPGDVLETFSLEMLAPELFGKKVEAKLELRGDTQGVRWWVSQIRVLPPQ
jgi:hypothetical protein